MLPSETYTKYKECFAPHVAQAVMEQRDKASLTRKNLAAQLGVSATNFTGWEAPYSRIQVWQFYALSEILGFDAEKELREIFAKAAPPSNLSRVSGKRSRLLDEIVLLTEEQSDALRLFLRGLRKGAVALVLALFLLCVPAEAKKPGETDLTISEAEGLRKQLREEGWLGGYKDKLVHVFLAETLVKSRNKCMNYVIDVSARYMQDLWELELATAIFFTNGDIVGVIPERDNRGFLMTFLCRPNGYAEFSSGVSSEAFRGLLP